jgi:hypothetical protein
VYIVRDLLRVYVLVALVLLIAVGINTAFLGERTSPNPIGSGINAAIVLLSPLIVVILAVWVGSRKVVAYVVAFLAIGFGTYGELAFYGTHLIEALAINFFAYWIAGIVALFAFGKKKP